MFIWVRQMMGRIQRERQIALHKSHLLCLLAKSLQENELCCNKEIQVRKTEGTCFLFSFLKSK